MPAQVGRRFTLLHRPKAVMPVCNVEFRGNMTYSGLGFKDRPVYVVVSRWTTHNIGFVFSSHDEDKKILAFANLKGSSIEKITDSGRPGFIVRIMDSDEECSLKIFCESEEDLKYPLKAFTYRLCPPTTLPVVIEEEQ